MMLNNKSKNQIRIFKSDNLMTTPIIRILNLKIIYFSNFKIFNYQKPIHKIIFIQDLLKLQHQNNLVLTLE